MSKSIYNSIGCSKSCQSKALSNTSIITNPQSDLNLEDFINQQNTQTQLAGGNAGGNITIVENDCVCDDFIANNSLTVFGQSTLNTVEALSISISNGQLNLQNNTISSNTDIILSPGPSTNCSTQVVIRENLTVEGCHTRLCTDDTYILDPVPTIGYCDGTTINDGSDRGWLFRYIKMSNDTMGFMGYDKDRERFVLWNEVESSGGKNYNRISTNQSPNELEADVLYTYKITNPDDANAPDNLAGLIKTDIVIESSNNVTISGLSIIADGPLTAINTDNDVCANALIVDENGTNTCYSTNSQTILPSDVGRIMHLDPITQDIIYSDGYTGSSDKVLIYNNANSKIEWSKLCGITGSTGATGPISPSIYGEMYLLNQTSTVSVTPMKITGFSEGLTNGVTFNGTNDRLLITTPGDYRVCVTVTSILDDVLTLEFYLYKNGVEIPYTIGKIGGPSLQTSTFTSLQELTPNDYIEVYASADTSESVNLDIVASVEKMSSGGEKGDTGSTGPISPSIYGEMYLENQTSVVSITPTKVTGFSEGLTNGVTFNGTNNRLIITTPGDYLVSGKATSILEELTLEFYLYKNGVEIPYTNGKIGGPSLQTITFTSLQELTTNDYIEVYASADVDESVNLDIVAKVIKLSSGGEKGDTGPTGSSPFEYNGTVVRPNSTHSNYDLNSDFVFGSQQLNDAGNTTEDARMIFDKSEAAFYVGTVDGTQWDTRGAASFIGGGVNNTATGNQAVVIGGNANTASGTETFAAGGGSSAIHNNSFVWSDSTGRSSSTTDEVTFGVAGGYRIFTNTLNTTGVTLASGGNSWAAVSDRNLKENIHDLGITECCIIAQKFRSIPVCTYNYIGNPEEQLCYGPIAQDWHTQFGATGVTGPILDHHGKQIFDSEANPMYEFKPAKDPLKIEIMDMIGIMMATIQHLQDEIELLKQNS